MRENIIKKRPHGTSKHYLKYGLTLREIAKKFGVSTTTVYSWLNDKRKCEWLEGQLEEIKK